MPGEITELLRKYDIRADKSLSQNFLTDRFMVGKIIKAATLDEKTAVIEIGSGLGSLTKELLNVSAFVYAIELDRRLCDILSAEYGCGKLEVINADIMKMDINPIIDSELQKARDVVVCANLPYHITTPVIMRLLEETVGLKSLTLMMQKEVADRILAKPGTKEYGAITPSIAYRAEASLVASVPPNCFIPRPGVYSSVVSIKILDEKMVSPKDERLMLDIIKAAFGQRRKTLINALSNQLSQKTGLSREQILECFANKNVAEMGVVPSMRGETLGIKEFAALADAFYVKKCNITEK